MTTPSIHHDPVEKSFSCTLDDHRSVVEYEIQGGTLTITHTFVPSELRGRGVASHLVRAAVDHARQNNLTPAATCSYAVAWLENHPLPKP